MSLNTLLAHWRADKDTAPNIPTWRTSPARAADLRPVPPGLPRELADALAQRGITSLYSHQVEAWSHARAGENVILATGTASGKTLGYNLPVLATLLEDPQARALYLFPTKALTQDQLASLAQYNTLNVQPAIYDGDTPQGQRPAIRKNSRIIFTNPDMLHTGILPHHTNWAEFFKNLKYIVIDEMHTYRGVFGSHVANIVRRLKRVARFYGAHPQFILTSATIGNPQGLAEQLIESPAALVDRDGSSRGERHFLVYNPPVIEESLGLRKSSLMESARLAQDLLANKIQSVVFARSRRSVEILLTYLQTGSKEVRGYRSGYLPGQRREIEKGLRDGSVKLVVATNALELGIDIGGLGAAILVGYPGTIASVYQQSGRAGRGDDPAAAVFVASPLPIDQFLAHHPEYFFARSPEQGLINPNHLIILLNHLRCAMFELPFERGEGFGALPAESVDEFLQFLVGGGESHLSRDKYFWMADQYPAAGISLRSASPENVILHTTDDKPQVIGEIDLASAPWLAHPNAIYLHEGQQYFVHDLNLETHIATVTAVALDYYTEPQRQTELALLADLTPEDGAGMGYGELQVSTRVAGYKKLRWFTNENLGEEPLDLPPTEFQTSGYWISLSEEMIETLRAAGAWSNSPNDYGPDWPRIRDRVRARDGYRCQVCSVAESGRQHDVHHKTPFRAFVAESLTVQDSTRPRPEILRAAVERANRLDNLVTLCPACHHKVEQNVRIRSGLAGLSYALWQLSPLFLMCDPGDLGTHTDAAGAVVGQPAVFIYENIPGGIGFSQKLYEMRADLIKRTLEMVSECPCQDGCPSCVGPGGENAYGGKAETLEILKLLCG